MVRIIEISPSISQIVGISWSDEKVIRRLQRALSYIHPSARAPTFVSGGWDGTVSLVRRYKSLNPDTPFVPTGTILKTRRILESMGFDVVVEYKRRLPSGPPKTLPGMFDFQMEALQCWRDYGGRAGIHLPMGTGKTTFVAGALIKWCLSEGIYPILFLCERIDILRQGKAKLEDAIESTIGLIGDGICDIKTTTVSTVQSLMSSFERKKDYPEARRPEVVQLLKSAQLIIVDEYHHSQAASYQKCLDRAQSAWLRMGMSGTPVSNEGLELLMEAAIGPIAFSKPYKYFIEHDPPVLARPTFYVYHMPRQRLPLPEHEDSSGASRYAAYYTAYVVENEERNKEIARFAMEMEKRGKSTAILVTRIRHGEILQEMIPNSVWLCGSHDGEYRERIFNQFTEKKFHVLISTLIKEAIDIPSLDCVVYACAGDSKITFPQSWRCMRTNIIDGKAKKTECSILTFLDRCRYIGEQSRSHLKMVDRPGFRVRHYGSIDPKFKLGN